MPDNPYENSLELRLLSATPLQLVVILYDGALAAVRQARAALAGGRIAERSRAITKTVEILNELTKSLDHSSGGDLSRNLAALYDYMQRRLLDANFRQADDGLAETEQLLSTLREPWMDASRAVETPAPEVSTAATVFSSEPSWQDEPVEAGASRQWSA